MFQNRQSRAERLVFGVVVSAEGYGGLFEPGTIFHENLQHSHDIFHDSHIVGFGNSWVPKIDQCYPSDVAEGFRGELAHFQVRQMKLQSLNLHMYNDLT